MVACLQSQYPAGRGMKTALSLDYILRRGLAKTNGGENRKYIYIYLYTDTLTASKCK